MEAIPSDMGDVEDVRPMGWTCGIWKKQAYGALASLLSVVVVKTAAQSMSGYGVGALERTGW